MIVDVALRDGETFEIALIEVAALDGNPVYPDCIACDKTKRIWLRSTYAYQNKARYDLILSNWSPNVIKTKF